MNEVGGQQKRGLVLDADGFTAAAMNGVRDQHDGDLPSMQPDLPLRLCMKIVMKRQL
jgi:hypothetical protein